MNLYRLAAAGPGERTPNGLTAPGAVGLLRWAAKWSLAISDLRRRWQDAAALAQADRHLLHDIGVAGEPAMEADLLYRRIRLVASGMSAPHLPPM